MRVGLIASAMVASACGGDGRVPSACVTAETRTCVCASTVGTQQCTSGTWTECSCFGPDAGIDASIDADFPNADAGSQDGTTPIDSGQPDTGDAGEIECIAGTQRCVDTQSFEVCGESDEGRVGNLNWGPRVICGAGNSCVDGRCDTRACIQPEILYLVDRSSSLSDDQWAMIRDGLQEFDRSFFPLETEGDGAIDRNVRTFPSSSCSTSHVNPLDGEFWTIRNGLDDGISSSGQTPIYQAFRNVRPVFGDPDQGQLAILITDGDETCDLDSDHHVPVSHLRTWGIRTHTIGIGTGANARLLSEIATTGGGSTQIVNTRTALVGALRSIVDPENVCPP